MMKKLLVTGTIIALMATPLAMAKGHGNGGEGAKHGHSMKMLRKLDLSSEQKEQVRSIMEQAKQDSERPSAEMREQMFAQKMALLDSASFDADAATAVIDQQQAQQKQRKLKMMAVQHQVYQILTEEQQVKYKALAQEKMDKMAERKEKGGKGKGKN